MDVIRLPFVFMCVASVCVCGCVKCPIKRNIGIWYFRYSNLLFIYKRWLWGKLTKRRFRRAASAQIEGRQGTIFVLRMSTVSVPKLGHLIFKIETDFGFQNSKASQNRVRNSSQNRVRNSLAFCLQITKPFIFGSGDDFRTAFWGRNAYLVLARIWFQRIGFCVFFEASLEFFLGRGRGLRGDRFSAKAGRAILLNFYQFGKCCGGSCRSAHGIVSYANVSPGVAFYLL